MVKNRRNVISLADVRMPELRDEISNLRERLQHVTDIFLDNEQSFEIVADIALALQSCETLAELDETIGGTMIERSADHARLYVAQPDGFAPDSLHIHPLAQLESPERDSLIGLDATHCETCREETYRALLGAEVDELASIARIPVAHKDFYGILVIGARDPDFFANDVGTLYLDFLGATLARSAARLLLELAGNADYQAEGVAQ